ncbi:FAD/NAD-P-binding domain-containing protein [Auriscalpium vulgare]|uniref:FAD/NAD-P-binding domain-containing protein n=1 Tax=Auriscalpium vulgare TaxID=40419 RepID=A0ACB8RPE9_9AGAM|nr:FAD/NAD-P-binding domain-containing protein [Auriscalpium vulgare]
MSGTPIKLRVAIWCVCIWIITPGADFVPSGGGVGGLTLAMALSQYPNIEVNVYEAATTFTEIGAGIGLWWRTRMVLRELNLEDDVMRLLDTRPSENRTPTLHYRKADQPEGVSFATIESRGGLVGVHRAEFHEVILRRLSPLCGKHTSKRLVQYIQSGDGSVQLVFQDGSTATCDLLVGADGLKSNVRSTLMQEFAATAEQSGRIPEAAEIRDCIRPRYSGVLVYRTLIPAEILRRVAPQHRVFGGAVQYLGKNRHLMAYPVSRGRFINLAAFDVDPGQEGSFYTEAWVTVADPRGVASLFQGWEPEVGQLIACLAGLKVNRWAVNVVKPLPSFASANVALLGDAAHAMTPFQGAGAGQAIEDAYILSALLGHRLTSRRTLANALRIYSSIRQPQTARVAERSRENGLHFALHGLNGTGLRAVGERIQANFEWVSETDPLDDLRRAVGMLEAAGAQ